MKLQVAPGIVVGVEVTQKQVCPAGTAYWRVDYTVEGVCIHSAATGAIWGRPDVIDLLDTEYIYNIYHYTDITNPDPLPDSDNREGRVVRVGTSGNRPAWWEEITTTHRKAIIHAYTQIVE